MDKIEKLNIPNNLSSTDLKELLKVLKLYKELVDKLWTRGKSIFKSIITWKSNYKVEYYSFASKKDSLEEGIEVYKKVFWEDVSPKDIVLSKKDNLDWGIRVYKDDALVDISFKKASEVLYK